MKKKASPLQLNVTLRVSLGNPWIVLIMVILGSSRADIQRQNPATNAASSQVVNIYRPFNSSEGCSLVQKDHELIGKQIALWQEASAAFRQYEEAKRYVSPEQLELLRKKAEYLAGAANSYQLETDDGQESFTALTCALAHRR